MTTKVKHIITLRVYELVDSSPMRPQNECFWVLIDYLWSRDNHSIRRGVVFESSNSYFIDYPTSDIRVEMSRDIVLKHVRPIEKLADISADVMFEDKFASGMIELEFR